MPETNLQENEVQSNEFDNKVIGNYITNHASNNAINSINRISELEVDLFSLPLQIQNLNWKQFCDFNEGIEIAGTNFEQDLAEDQIAMVETITNSSNSRLIVSSTTHLIPSLENPDTKNIFTKARSNINNKGFIVIQQKDNLGLVFYISFLPGKKIFGLYTAVNGINQFFYIGSVKTDSIIPNVSVNNLIPRSIDDELTEVDRIIISNASQRFKNRINNWVYVKDAINYFNDLLTKTVDPAYITKLITLNKELSFAK